tara:strand:- start:20098 stop:20403 length:306 start_codon:yes stop_codon:yes gene_type:complete
MSSDDLYFPEVSINTWTERGLIKMSIYDDLHSGHITYDVHPRHMKELNSLVPGDLVETPNGEIGLIVDISDKDVQGFNIYTIMIGGSELFYSSLELVIVGE